MSTTPPLQSCSEARTAGRFWMEDAVIDRFGPHIGAIGIAVYAYLSRRADRQGVCFPSYQTVAQQLNLSRRTVITYVRLLEQHGLLVAATRSAPRGRRANAYRLVSLSPGDNGAAVAPVQQDHWGGPAGSPFGPANGHQNGAAVAPVHHDHQGGAAGSPFGPANGRRNGAAVALVQHDHQDGAAGSPLPPAEGHQNGAAVAPVQQVHQGDAADSPGVVQHDHQGGATVAPEGLPLKETQEKESQRKERKNGTLRIDDTGPATRSSLTSLGGGVIECTQSATPEVSPAKPAGDDEAAMMAALCRVTGKDLGLLREAKRREYVQSAGRLQERGFVVEDVRDFAAYWQQAHPIGSKKPNAGYPHVVQVLEDLAGALPWIQEQRRRREEVEAWQEDVRGCLPGRAPKLETDPQAQLLWECIRDDLILHLPTPTLQADLHRAKPISLADGTLLVELPNDATAEWWRLRLQRPVSDATARVVDHSLTVTFTGPNTRPSPTQWSPS